MADFLTFFTAICFGISAGALTLLVLQTLLSMEVDRNAMQEKHGLPLSMRLLLPLVPNLRRITRGKMCRSWCESLEVQLWMAGEGETLPATDLAALKILFTLLGLAVPALGAAADFPWMGILMGLLLHLYPGLWLREKIRRRQLEILKALPNVLDLLTLSVEAGKDFITSLRDILQRRKTDALGEELLRAFHEIQLGRKRAEALRALSNRVRQPELTSVVNSIIQAEELGVSIGQLLRIQGDMLRMKRFNLAEKLANQAPLKIVFPVVLFIFPAVILVLLVPIGIKLLPLLGNG